jgi:hypothetical protein
LRAPALLRASPYATYAISCLIVAAFVAFTVAKGVPAMRHDWWMSADPAALRAAAVSALETWRNDGMGGAALYPNDYVFYAYVLAWCAFLPPVAVLGAIAATIGVLAALAARAFAGDDRAWVATAGTLLVLLFNPWTYTELVAGHLPMLLSFAGMALLAAETARGPRASVALQCVATVAVAQQLQFLLLALPATGLLWAMRGRPQPFAVAALLFVPVAIGVTLGAGDLAQIPYSLDWEKNQSLHVPAALGLRGYFAHYDDALGIAATIGSTLLVATVVAALVSIRTRAQWIVACACCVLLCFATGTNGAFAPAYESFVTNVKASAVFRELYDLAGVLAVGYVTIVAAAFARGRWAHAAVALTGILMLVSWIYAPPSRFWIPSSSIPVSTVDAGPNVRFAVFPAFQPLTFRGQGSGPDPDVFNRPGNVAPLNSYLSAYPAVTALATYSQTGHAAPLAALSVAEAIQRPWLCTDAPSLRAQVTEGKTRSAFGAPACGTAAAPVRFAPIAELTVAPGYSIGTLDRNVGAGNVLAVDAQRAQATPGDADATVVPRSAGGTDPTQEWIDARLVFSRNSAFGQAYGGVYTTSEQALDVVPGDALLVYVRGRLTSRDVRRTLATGGDATGYRWLTTAAGVHAVRCFGECIVAAETPATGGYPLDPPEHPSVPVNFSAIAPWLLRATLPPVPSGGLLRYNVSYSRYWAVLGNARTLRHVRVDGAVNGWIARSPAAAAAVTIVEWRSAAEAMAELTVCVVLIAWACAAALTRRRRTRTA